MNEMARLPRLRFRRERRVQEVEVPPVPMVGPKGMQAVDLQVRVHENAEGVRYVDVDTVMTLLRAMMKGPAAPVFCDQYEVALRRAVDHAVAHGRQQR